MRGSNAVSRWAQGLLLALLVSACASDPSLTAAGTVDGAAAAEADPQAPAEAASREDGATPSPPESESVEAESESGEAGSDGAADARPDRSDAVRTVTWLDTDFDLPTPWEELSSDGGTVRLNHPTAAGSGQDLYVTLDARDGAPTAAQLDAVPLSSPSGGRFTKIELPAVFATGGPGLQIGEAGETAVSVVSDTGVQASISVEDSGSQGGPARAVPQAAIDAVLALLATIDPPTVIPAPDPVTSDGVTNRDRLRIDGLRIPRGTCAVYNNPATPPDAAGNYDGNFVISCDADQAVADAARAAFDEILAGTLLQCPGRREAVRTGPPPGYALWSPDGRVEVDCSWRPSSDG